MSHALLDLFKRDQLPGIGTGIAHAVARSFESDGARITSSEVKRRFQICVRVLRQLRGDLGWGVQRALDRLPHYLRCELDGQSWEPDARTTWMPDDGK